MQTRLFPVLLAALFGTVSVQAVQFNVEGLKNLQDKGLELANQADNLRALKTGDDKCLHVAGSVNAVNQGIKVVTCNGNINQKWRTDDQSRLVNAGGFCLTYAGKLNKPGGQLRTEDCTAANSQNWRINEIGQIVSKTELCIDAGGKVTTLRQCGNGAMQKWEWQ